MKNSDILYIYLCWENGVLQRVSNGSLPIT